MWFHSEHNFHTRTARDYSIFVTVAAFIGYAFTLAMNAVAAHILPQVEFGEFSSAVAMVGIICTCATLGLEKYALRLLPQYIVAADLRGVKGYICFGVAICILVGVAISIGAFSLYTLFKIETQNLNVLAQILWFVPVIAIFLFALEIATTFGAIIWSTAIYRIIFPFITLVGMAALSWKAATPSVGEAVNVYGFSWVFALVLMLWVMHQSAPKGLYLSPFSFAIKKWLIEGVEYLGFSLLMTVFSQAAILTIEVVRGDRISVGLIAAAMQISTLVIIVQTATMRVFGPRLAILIAAKDAIGQRQLMRRRAWFMFLFGIAFFAAVVMFGREMLDLFGAEYKVAYQALVVLTIGNVVNTILGFAPTYLQFHEAHRITLKIAALGTIVGILVMGITAAYGTYLDVAYAYSFSVIAMYGAFQIAAMVVSKRVISAQS